MQVIGLMSGTSLDGVDAALITTDGETVQGFGPSLTLPYTPGLRALLARVIAALSKPGAPDPPYLEEAEARLTDAHVEAVRRLGVTADLIGFHGQTVLHAPERRLTRQIGDAAALAHATQTPVACDFRLADVAAGGQGAPLAPLFHAALAADQEKPLLVVNIGGVANLTYLGEGGDILACDTGPGNALLDDFMAARTGTPLDRDGAMARAGRPDERLLAAWLADPFFALPAPKSLDRQHFAGLLPSLAGATTADGATTLAAFTARAIAAAPLPGKPKRVLVTGGGRHNPAIMDALRLAFGVTVQPVEDAGWDGDALEAQCFAYLAARVVKLLPLSLPATTGVPRPLAGGRIVRAVYRTGI
jgi:anhydro-N-acetylmuramic acid kinase